MYRNPRTNNLMMLLAVARCVDINLTTIGMTLSSTLANQLDQANG